MSEKEEIEKLKKEIEELKENFKIVAYAKINEKGDLFDLRLQNNPYSDQNKVVPLFRFFGNLNEAGF